MSIVAQFFFLCFFLFFSVEPAETRLAHLSLSRLIVRTPL
jgi:hypothetical protein